MDSCFRHAGAIGAGSSPSKVIKGMKMAGQLGDTRVTTRNLEVIRVGTERNLLFVRGAVLDHNNALVKIRKAVMEKRVVCAICLGWPQSVASRW